MLVDSVACRPERVAQVWLPDTQQKKFKELVSRLHEIVVVHPAPLWTVLLWLSVQVSRLDKRVETRHLVQQCLLLEPGLEEEQALLLAGRLATMYQVLTNS